MRGIISWFVLFHSLPHPLFLLLLTFPLSSDCRMFLSPLSLRFQKGNAMQRTSIGQLPISSGTSLIFSSPLHPLALRRYAFLSDPFTKPSFQYSSTLSSILSPSGMVDLAIGHYDLHLKNIYSLSVPSLFSAFASLPTVSLFHNSSSDLLLFQIPCLTSFGFIPRAHEQQHSRYTSQNRILPWHPNERLSK
jgi:hypothetical protein